MNIWHKISPKRISPDRIASYQCERHELFRAEHENVKRVVVVREGSWDKSVVSGIMGGSIEDTVHYYETRLLVQLVFDLTSLADLDNSDEIIGTYSFWTDLMPNIHRIPPRRSVRASGTGTEMI